MCIIDHNPCGSVHPLCCLGTNGAPVCAFACHPYMRLLAWVLTSMPPHVLPVTTFHLCCPGCVIVFSISECQHVGCVAFLASPHAKKAQCKD